RNLTPRLDDLHPRALRSLGFGLLHEVAAGGGLSLSQLRLGLFEQIDRRRTAELQLLPAATGAGAVLIESHSKVLPVTRIDSIRGMQIVPCRCPSLATRIGPVENSGNSD